MLDLDEVTDSTKHACENRPVVVLGGLADPAEAERTQRAAVAFGLAYLATRLGDSNFRHRFHLVALSH
jgi:hypothetical protein